MTGEEVKEMRKDFGLSQERFAHLIGVSLQTVNRWEKGWSKPSILAEERIDSIKRGALK